MKQPVREAKSNNAAVKKAKDEMDEREITTVMVRQSLSKLLRLNKAFNNESHSDAIENALKPYLKRKLKKHDLVD